MNICTCVKVVFPSKKCRTWVKLCDYCYFNLQNFEELEEFTKITVKCKKCGNFSASAYYFHLKSYETSDYSCDECGKDIKFIYLCKKCFMNHLHKS